MSMDTNRCRKTVSTVPDAPGQHAFLCAVSGGASAANRSVLFRPPRQNERRSSIARDKQHKISLNELLHLTAKSELLQWPRR